MPPTIRKTQHPLLDPEQASVLDSPLEKIARRIIATTRGVMGEGDPTDMMGATEVGPMSPLTVPLITIYKNAIARAKATEAFKLAAAKLGTNVSQAAEGFARRWPRVAAHMNLKKDNTLDLFRRGPMATSDIPHGVVREPIDVTFTRRGLKSANSDLNEAVATLVHEGTHVAQALGDRGTGRQYALANRAVGYEINPYERGAERAALRALDPDNPAYKHIPTLREMQEVVDYVPRDPVARRTLEDFTSAMKIPAVYGKAIRSNPEDLHPVAATLMLKRILEKKKKRMDR